MPHPYFLDFNNEDSWMYATAFIRPDGNKGEDQRTLSMPEGPDRLFYITDSVMYPPSPGSEATDLHCHEHYTGWEVFFVDEGSMDLYVNGKKVFVDAGSILHIQPYEAHAMRFYSPTKYRLFGHGMTINANTAVIPTLLARDPNFRDDPEYPVNSRRGGSDTGSFGRETPVWEEAPVEQCSTVRHISRPLATFKLDGVTAKMITARWENGGINELWAYEMEKGFKVKTRKFCTQPQMYYVTAGQVKFTVFDEEFIAKPGCVVKVPKLGNCSIEALTDAVIYDVGGLPRMQAYMLDRASILKYDPERAKDPATFANLREKFNIQLLLG
ncbi:MAG: cupin domain-containing protein [Clostridiales bacterium]|nr:cupin domain-containing protein [Clostridiales bacterium]